MPLHKKYKYEVKVTVTSFHLAKMALRTQWWRSWWPKLPVTLLIANIFTFNLPHSPAFCCFVACVFFSSGINCSSVLSTLGNAQTLKQEPKKKKINVYKRLRAFWKKHYSAHYMTLALQSKGLAQPSSQVIVAISQTKHIGGKATACDWFLYIK